MAVLSETCIITKKRNRKFIIFKREDYTFIIKTKYLNLLFLFQVFTSLKNGLGKVHYLTKRQLSPWQKAPPSSFRISGISNSFI